MSKTFSPGGKVEGHSSVGSSKQNPARKEAVQGYPRSVHARLAAMVSFSFPKADLLGRAGSRMVRRAGVGARLAAQRGTENKDESKDKGQK